MSKTARTKILPIAIPEGEERLSIAIPGEGLEAGGQRALATYLAIPEESLYQASMHAELQKFRNPTKARQLLLSEGVKGEELEQALEATGLDLSVSEDRALSAVQKLLHKTGYQGHQAKQVDSDAFHWSGSLPTLVVTYPEYLEAYGLAGRYEGHQAMEAIEALESLAKPRRLVFQRSKWVGEGKGREKRFDVIVITKPLLSITRGYKDLTPEEAKAVREGQELAGRVKLAIEAGPLLVMDIKSFFLLKPANLHEEIQAFLGSKGRISRAISLFIELLLTWNKATMKIARDKLAERLSLHKWIEHRKQARLEQTLQECFRVAKALRYLLDWEQDAFGVLTFSLNPERCKRVGTEGEEH
jgi:hypothetical protein